MAWVTQTTIQRVLSAQELIYLTDDTGAGAVDTDNMDQCITEATAEIKARLLSRYPAECAAETSDAVVNMIAMVFTVRNLYSRRPAARMPLLWDNRITRAETLLEYLVKGEASPADWTADTDLITIAETHYPDPQNIHEMEAEQETIDL